MTKIYLAVTHVVRREGGEGLEISAFPSRELADLGAIEQTLRSKRVGDIPVSGFVTCVPMRDNAKAYEREKRKSDAKLQKLARRLGVSLCA